MEKGRKNNTKKSETTKKRSDETSKAKKTRRGNDTEAGLKPRFFSKIKREYHDIDYADQLTDPKVRSFLNNFMEEWVGARLNHPGKKFHKNKKDRKRIWDANNQRNRDMMGKFDRVSNNDNCKATDILEITQTESPEDALIEMIDLKKASKL